MNRLFSTAITGIVILGSWNYSMGQTYVYYVDASALGADDGSNWCDAYVHLEHALDTTVNTDLASHLSQSHDIEIWVANGTYYPPTGSGFQLLPTVRVYGGFSGVSTPAAINCVNDGETLLSQRNSNPATNGTILSGDIDNATNPDDPDGTINGTNAAVIVRGALNNDSAILDYVWQRRDAANPRMRRARCHAIAEREKQAYREPHRLLMSKPCTREVRLRFCVIDSGQFATELWRPSESRMRRYAPGNQVTDDYIHRAQPKWRR